MTPELSIVIVAYQSRNDLEACLPSIEAQAYHDYEVVIVDNDPAAGLAGWLGDRHPRVRVVANAANTGYAGGNNLGFQHARGRFVLVLNPDTVLHPGALGALVATARAHPNAFINPKLLSPDGSVNACGLQMHLTGITTCRGLGEPSENYLALHEVPLLSGAAFLAPAELLRSLGGFDDGYFMYMEDVDLSLRAKLLGFRLLCDPRAVIDHHYQQNMTAGKYYFLERNRLATVFRIYEARTFRKLVPSLLLTEGLVWGYALVQGPRYLASRLRAYGWLWQERRRLGVARRRLQQDRRAGDAAILDDCLTSLPFDQLIENRRLAGLLDRLLRPLYTLGRPRPHRRRSAL